MTRGRATPRVFGVSRNSEMLRCARHIEAKRKIADNSDEASNGRQASRT
jgi:hypothetical protein